MCGIVFTEGRSCGTVGGIFRSLSSLPTRSLRASISFCRSWICGMSVSVVDSEAFSFPKIVELNVIKRTNDDILSAAMIY